MIGTAVRRLLQSAAESVDDEEELAPKRAALAALGPGAMPALVKALQDPSEEIRVAAADALRSQPGDSAVRALVSALDDDSIRVRFRVAESLTVLRDRRAVPALLRQYAKENETTVRNDYLAALGAIGDPAAIPTLIAATESGEPTTRLWAMHALCAMGASQAKTRAIDLVRDPNPEVRAHTLVACESALDTPSGQAVLIKQAVEGDFQTSVLARRLLGSFRKAQAPRTGLSEQMSSSAQEALGDPARSLNAAFVLADLGDRRAVPVLIPAVNGQPTLVRLMAMRQLGELGDPRAVPVLLGALADGEEAIAAMAYNSLQRFAQDGDKAAAEAVGQFKGKKFDQPLTH